MATGGQTRVLRRCGQGLEKSKPWARTRADYDEEGEAVLAVALCECLDEMQNNGGDIDAALGRSPHLAVEIRPLLEVAALLLPERV